MDHNTWQLQKKQQLGLIKQPEVQKYSSKLAIHTWFIYIQDWSSSTQNKNKLPVAPTVLHAYSKVQLAAH